VVSPHPGSQTLADQLEPRGRPSFALGFGVGFALGLLLGIVLTEALIIVLAVRS
jgi:hypothetical protein